MESLENLETITGFLDTGKDEVMERWGEGEDIAFFFETYMDKETFLEGYGGHIYDYFLGVVRGDKEIGECPFMNKLIDFLRDRQVNVSDVFLVCMHLRQAVIDFILSNTNILLIGVDLRKTLEEVNHVFNQNLAGVLRFYASTVFEQGSGNSLTPQRLLEAVPVPAVTVNEEDEMVHWNDEFAALFGEEEQSRFHELEGGDLRLDGLFVEEKGLLYSTDLMNWKENFVEAGWAYPVRFSLKGSPLFKVKLRPCSGEKGLYVACFVPEG